jgi:hypothetical protein
MRWTLVVASSELSTDDGIEHHGIGAYECELLFAGGRSRDAGLGLFRRRC